MRKSLSAIILVCMLVVSGSVLAADSKTEAQGGTVPVVLSLLTPVQWPSSDSDLTGFRLDLLYGQVHDNTGLTIGLVNMADGRSRGVDLGAVNITQGDCKGVQWGLVNVSSDKCTGWQEGWAFSYVGKDMKGIQDGLLAALTMGRMSGFQCGLYTQCDTLKGMQFGLVNVSGDATGFQLGLVNGAGKMNGVQVGLVNVIKEGPLVFFPIVNMCF